MHRRTKNATSYPSFSERSKPEDELTYRSFSVRPEAQGGPRTLDRDARSLDVTAATENPVHVWDRDRYEVVNEVLLMSGAQLPRSGQVPLLDAHSRWNSADVLGSARNLKTENRELSARAVFSTVPRADEVMTKYEEGHLTDFSIGYKTLKSVWVDAGKTRTIQGKDYAGPLKVTTKWLLREVSTVPIGADELATARTARQETHTRRQNMPGWLKTWLEERGLWRDDITEAQARELFEKEEMQRAAPPPAPAAGDTAAGQNDATVDVDKVRADAAREEQDRITEIRAMCEHHNVAAQADGLIKRNATVDEARKAVLDELLKRRRADEGTGFRPNTELVADERDKFRSAAADSISIRTGIALEKPSPGCMDLAGFSLRELAREALRVQGLSTSGNVLDMVGRALTTSDFPYVLAAAANKSLLDGWENAGETWSAWCGTGSVPDFKTLSLVRASEYDDLEQVREDGEYKYGGRSESREQVQVVTYGKIYSLSRQAIINDDLGALTDAPRGHGEAAARKVGDLPYAVLTANAAMGDGNSLFDTTNHANVGTSAVISTTSVAEGIKLMKQQKDIAAKRRLNIRPEFFIGPTALEGSAEVFFRSVNYMAEATAGTPDEAVATTRANPYAGTYFTRVYDARLDDNSTTTWYLAARKGKTVVVFFLNGIQAPYMEQRQGWTVDGMEYKVRIDAAAKAVDWRGLLSNAGGA